VACTPDLPSECEKHSSFFELSLNGRHLEIKTFPLEKQVDVYLCGMFRHPPSLGLADDIADGGEKILPYLTERLKSEKNERNQQSIIYLLKIVSTKNYLRNREDIVEQIRQVVSDMKSEQFRERSREWLEQIEKNSLK
jgi:hypothetical protein